MKNLQRKLLFFASIQEEFEKQKKRGEINNSYELSYEIRKNENNFFCVTIKNAEKVIEGGLNYIRDMLSENIGEKVYKRYYYGCSGFPEMTYTENYQILKN